MGAGVGNVTHADESVKGKHLPLSLCVWMRIDLHVTVDVLTQLTVPSLILIVFSHSSLCTALPPSIAKHHDDNLPVPISAIKQELSVNVAASQV